MTEPRAQFRDIYLFGLAILWVSTTAIFVLYASVALGPDFLDIVMFTFSMLAFFTLIGMPIAAVASLFIGGTIWKIGGGLIQNDSLRASLAGGITGASVMGYLLFFIAKTDPNARFVIIIALFFLGNWCGWLGERLAKQG